MKPPYQPKQYIPDTNRITDEMASLLSIANVAFVVSPVPVTNESYKLIRDGDVKVYESGTVLPRAYLAYNWMGVKSIRRRRDGSSRKVTTPFRRSREAFAPVRTGGGLCPKSMFV